VNSDNERRCYDGEIADIRKLIEVNTTTHIRMALDVQKISVMQESYIKQIDELKDDTKDNTQKIASITVKQNILSVIGGAAILAVFTASAKYIVSHIKG
jgi:hypothetical protein